MNAPNAAAVPSTIENLLTNVPEITLPNGTVVPAFKIGTYLCSRGDDGQPISVADRKPWVSINYYDSLKVCADAGKPLLGGLQSLAISWDIYNQDENWAGGKVGEGKIFQGLHKGTVNSAQAGDYESADPEERRWYVLSNGEKIWDWSGNAFPWLRDDIHGDPETGLISQVMPADSPYLTTCPAPIMEQGTGWRPDGERDWSGYALIRGGYWYSEDVAGVFSLYYGWPGNDYTLVGFRFTKPVSGA